MTTVSRLAILVFLSTQLLQVIPKVLAGTCSEDPRCVPADACDACRQFKCNLAQSQGLTGVDCVNLSPLIGGNQCCDNSRTRKVDLRRKRQAYNFDLEPQRKWSSPVGYAINGTINITSNIRAALSYIEAQTCIRFAEVSPNSPLAHIIYTAGSSCTAYVGRSEFNSTPITLTSDCLSKFGDMVYYTVQTLGMWHQSQRRDRNDYITINNTNTEPSHLADFAILDSNLLVTYGLPYDLASIQHFPAKAYTKNGDFTIITNDPLYQQTIGQRVQLSYQDAKLLNIMYCQNVCSNSTLNGVCKNGGYQDPNDCNRCRCPDGFSGRFCTDYETAPGDVCGGLIIASPTEMNLSSPGYYSPGFYNDQAACAWHIAAPKGGNISLKFVGDFGVYQDPSYACYHWVEVRFKGGLNNTGPRFCGPSLPRVELVSNGSEALVIFRSNLSGLASNLRRGFQIAYKVVNAPACAFVVCQNGGTCINGVCNCPSTASGINCETLLGELPSPASSTPALTSPPPPTDCNPNPCHNNGTCALNGNAVTCTCANGFRGQYCTDAPCGGCNSSPGQVDIKCIVPESPLRFCQLKYNVETKTGWWFWCRTKTRAAVRNVTCSWSVCCDNARDIGNGCGVIGWTDWSKCSASCGGGTQVKRQYGFRTDKRGNLVYDVLSTQKQNCKTNKCTCNDTGSDDDDDDDDDDKKHGRPHGIRKRDKYRDHGWWPWFPPCRACNGPTFVESNNTCSTA